MRESQGDVGCGVFVRMFWDRECIMVVSRKKLFKLYLFLLGLCELHAVNGGKREYRKDSDTIKLIQISMRHRSIVYGTEPFFKAAFKVTQ